MKAVKPVDRGFEGEFATSDLQPLNQIRRARTNKTPKPFSANARPIAGREIVSLRGSADQQKIGTFADPAVAGADARTWVVEISQFREWLMSRTTNFWARTPKTEVELAKLG